MRQQLPADPFDRITSTERDVELMEAEVSALRRARGARGVMPRPLYMVRTTDWWNGSAYSYPSGNSATPDLRLPIVTQSVELDGSGRPTYTNRTQYASHKAFCPQGWYPPGIQMAAWWNGERFIITSAPKILHGVTTSAITTASWDSGELTLGNGTVHYYEETSAAVYEEATYAAGGDVIIKAYNIADAVAINKGVTLSLSEAGRWEVMVEPCDLVYA